MENQVKLFEGTGQWGKCRGCGADGFWEHVREDCEAGVDLIRCECGHEEVI